MSARLVQLGEEFPAVTHFRIDGSTAVYAHGSVTICTDFVDPGGTDRRSPDWRKHCVRCDHAEWKHAAVLSLVGSDA